MPSHDPLPSPAASSKKRFQLTASTRDLLLISLAVLTLFTGTIASAVYYQNRRMAEAEKWVIHTHQVIEHIDAYLLATNKVSIAQKGYFLTHDPTYRELYAATLRGKPDADLSQDSVGYSFSLDQELRILRFLTADNPQQQARVSQLETDTRELLAYLASSMDVFDRGGLTALTGDMAPGRSKIFKDEIRALTSEMRIEEERLLKIRNVEDAGANDRNIEIVIGSIILFYCGLLALAVLLVKTITRLREANHLNQAILASTSYLMIAADTTGKIIAFNAEAERELGYRADEVVGKVTKFEWHDLEEIKQRAQELSKELGRPVEPSLDVFTLKPEKEGMETREWTYIRKNGSRFPVTIAVTVLQDETGRTTGYLGVIENITERKRTQNMKDEFTAIVSHELRTPLTSIRGALGLMNRGVVGDLPPQAAELTQNAYESCERLIRIINDILDVEKLESGKMQMIVKPIPIKPMLEQALRDNRPYGEKFGIRFSLKKDPPDIDVMADSGRLLQVLANLMSNAAKFSPQGSEVLLSCEDQKDGTVRFQVQDFGPGIPDEFRPHIFEKFSQAEGANVRRREGTGLGLSIAKNFVEAMHGKMEFLTQIGKGTTFFFELPKAQDGARPAPRPAPSAQTGRPIILVCEDDHLMSQFLALILKNAGFECEVARTLAVARRKLSERTFAGIILDLKFPDGNAIELLPELKNAPDTAHLPIIIVSGYIEEGKRMLAGDAIGVVDWIPKPFDDERLISSLNRAVSGRPKPRILHVEDDINLMRFIDQALAGRAELVMAPTLREAREQLKSGSFDLMILDIGFPDGSGIELLGQLSELTKRPVPVLILSASEVDEKVGERVAASLVKSRVSETKIVDTILVLLRQHSPHSEGVPP